MTELISMYLRRQTTAVHTCAHTKHRYYKYRLYLYLPILNYFISGVTSTNTRRGRNTNVFLSLLLSRFFFFFLYPPRRCLGRFYDYYYYYYYVGSGDACVKLARFVQGSYSVYIGIHRIYVNKLILYYIQIVMANIFGTREYGWQIITAHLYIYIHRYMVVTGVAMIGDVLCYDDYTVTLYGLTRIKRTHEKV